MYTSIVLTALSGLMAARAPSVEVKWSSDYRTARQAVRTEGKPLAVFLGSGENGFEKVCRDGVWSKSTKKALQNEYVCVYVDMDSADGRRLAKGFSITKSTGLVLSDRSGTKQAYRHNGSLQGADMTRALTHFAAPNVVVRKTVTDLRTVTRANSTAPTRRASRNAVPRSIYSPPFAGFQAPFGPPMGFGGGCAGGG
jgi:hypothetical protein